MTAPTPEQQKQEQQQRERDAVAMFQRRWDEYLRCPPTNGDRFHRPLGETPTNETLEMAIDAQLSINCLPVFLCDSAGATKEKIG